MMNSLIKFASSNVTKIFMSTSIQKGVVNNSRQINKLDHYRNLNALEKTDVKPSGWDEAKPHDAIPGPKPWPIIGNAWRFALPFGDFYGLDFLGIHKMLHKQYGDISIIKGLYGQKPLVLLFNEQDIEKLHRNEGVWPVREALKSFHYYRKSRNDLFKNTGLVTYQGEEWFKVRSIINPILMQPRNVLQYIGTMNNVADELIDNMKYFASLNQYGEMPEDFNIELYKWSFESIGIITMNKRLGCLKRGAEKDFESQKLIQSALIMFQLMYKLDVLPSVWKIISTPNWRKFVEVLDFLSETNLRYINFYLEQMNNGKDEEANDILGKLVKVDKHVAIAMAVDMMIAGIDTTGRILAAALYHLAKNPEAQQKLRGEACGFLKTPNSPVTKEILSKASYLKAVIKETTRISPIAIGNFRTTVKKIVLGGHQIPKGTDVLASNLMLCNMDKHFIRAKEFLPERWLSETTGELSHKNTNPFVFAPFGYGPRSCAGKRLANLEFEVALLKIVRNFELEWPHQDMVFKTMTLHGIAHPLKIHIKSVDC